MAPVSEAGLAMTSACEASRRLCSGVFMDVIRHHPSHPAGIVSSKSLRCRRPKTVAETRIAAGAPAATGTIAQGSKPFELPAERNNMYE